MVAWLTCLALLFGSLAPAAARTMKARDGNGGQWSDICTVNGVKRVLIANADHPLSAKPDAAESSVEHCAACLTHLLPGLPAAGTFLVFVAEAAQRAQPVFDFIPQPRVVWPGARSRAPPFYA